MGKYDTSIGLLLIGIFLNTYLYGIVTYQFASYYSIKFNDPPWIKITVFALLIVDTFHSGSLIYLAWQYCVANYDNPPALLFGFWPYCFTPIGSAIAAILTQNFMAYRIYRMTSNKFLYMGIVAFALSDLALATFCGARAWMIQDLQKVTTLSGTVTAWLALQASLDIFIAGFTAIGLYRQRTKYCHTNKVLNRYIRSTIQIGFFSSLFAIGNLIGFLVWPGTELYGMFAVPIGRIYTNALMDTLIVRDGMKKELAGVEEFLDTEAVAGVSSINRGGQWQDQKSDTHTIV
ncbi:hypothetical protein AX15_002448 [Amanita polypyramis BW_CC]|nr:hypothetical protein AX15_002448 [Amanita polypyramis BW_CC]